MNDKKLIMTGLVVFLINCDLSLLVQQGQSRACTGARIHAKSPGCKTVCSVHGLYEGGAYAAAGYVAGFGGQTGETN